MLQIKRKEKSAKNRASPGKGNAQGETGGEGKVPEGKVERRGSLRSNDSEDKEPEPVLGFGGAELKGLPGWQCSVYNDLIDRLVDGPFAPPKQSKIDPRVAFAAQRRASMVRFDHSLEPPKTRREMTTLCGSLIFSRVCKTAKGFEGSFSKLNRTTGQSKVFKPNRNSIWF